MNIKLINILFFIIIIVCLLYSIKYNNFFNNELNNYLQTNSIIELQYKTNNKTNNKNELIQDYISKIKPLNNKEQDKINKLTTKINKLEIFNNYNWNIMKTEHLELGYSYTVGNKILLDKSYINSSNNNDLIDTLIHEKIHINQRQNQLNFNKSYKKLFPELKLINKPINIDIIKDNFITNPDANNSTWLIKDKGKLYIVPYIYNNNNTTRDTAYLVRYKNKKYKVTNKTKPIIKLEYYNKLKNKYKIKGGINITHPNETLVSILLPQIKY